MQDELSMAVHMTQSIYDQQSEGASSNLCTASELEQFKITFSRAVLAYNNHVGNEWSYYVSINDVRLYEKGTTIIDLRPGQKFKISCYLSESNEKYVDRGSSTAEISYADLISYRQNGFRIPVEITEGNGRYKGNKAQMDFHFAIE